VTRAYDNFPARAARLVESPNVHLVDLTPDTEQISSATTEHGR